MKMKEEKEMAIEAKVGQRRGRTVTKQLIEESEGKIQGENMTEQKRERKMGREREGSNRRPC